MTTGHMTEHIRREILMRGLGATAGNPDKAIAMSVGAVGVETDEKLFDEFFAKESSQISMKEQYREQGRRYRKAVWERRVRKLKKLFSQK